MKQSAITSHTIKIGGKVTSVSLESGFYDGLKHMASARNVSINVLVASIDKARDSPVNLSSALRLAVLDFYRERAGVVA